MERESGPTGDFTQTDCVFFALLAGGAALGMLGLLIALPLTATLVILFQELVSPALRQFADEPG